MNRFHLASITVLASAIAAMAPIHAATAERSADQEQEAKADPVRCKDTMVLGSRIPVRVCRRQSEWDAEQQALQDERRSSSGASRRCGEVAKC